MSNSDQAAVTEPWRFRAVIYFCCGVQVLAAIYEITRGTLFAVVIGVVLLVGAVGLFRRLRWGRQVSVVFFWLLLVFAIGMILPARIEGDVGLGVESPTVLELVTQLVVLCSVAIGSLHLLGRYKLLFRPGRF